MEPAAGSHWWSRSRSKSQLGAEAGPVPPTGAKPGPEGKSSRPGTKSSFLSSLKGALSRTPSAAPYSGDLAPGAVPISGGKGQQGPYSGSLSASQLGNSCSSLPMLPSPSASSPQSFVQTPPRWALSATSFDYGGASPQSPPSISRASPGPASAASRKPAAPETPRPQAEPETTLLAIGAGALPAGMDRPAWCLEDYEITQLISQRKVRPRGLKPGRGGALLRRTAKCPSLANLRPCRPAPLQNSFVYKALCRLSGLEVALKVCQLPQLSLMQAAQLRREVALQSRLYHRHIIRLYGAFQQGDAVCLVQELADGVRAIKPVSSPACAPQRAWGPMAGAAVAAPWGLGCWGGAFVPARATSGDDAPLRFRPFQPAAADRGALLPLAAQGDMYAALLKEPGSRMSERRAAEAVVRPLMRALDYMHSMCMAHR